MKKKLISIALLMLLVVATVFPCFADDDATDLIRDYEITADVNEDATVTLTYHIEWEVLESDYAGALSWVQIGIPNSHVEDCTAFSDNIDDVEIHNNYAEVYFDDEYYEGDVVSFDFTLQQDYMYSMNAVEEGETTYYFTPGWFDSIDVEKLVIKWSSDQATSWDGPGQCLIKNGYCTWETSMDAGDTVSIQVNYPNDAFSFDENKDYEEDSDYYYDDDEFWDAYDEWNEYDEWDSGFGSVDIIGTLISILMVLGVPAYIFSRAASALYSAGSGFKGKEKKTKITRTKIVYYPNCPSCGAARTEGKDVCEYCGRSMIKEEEILKEEPVDDEDQEAYAYDKDGTFRYSDSPDTYVRVHVTPITIHTSNHHHHHGGGGGSCAHSSCACACASCACACACACAGGGRAGCTAKDFYRTNLKLKQLELKKKHRKK